MRRRDLLRAAGALGILSALPLSGCATGSGPAATGRPSTSVPSTPLPSTAVKSPPSADGRGGRLVQAAVARQSSPPAESVRGKLLPVSAALYRTALTGTGNAVLSPYSIVAALGMLAVGARGATARHLSTVMGGDAGTVAGWVTGSDAALARAVALSAENSGDSPPSAAVVDPANAVFLRPGSPVLPAYLDALAAGYGAGIRQVDFADAAGALATMNDWVSRRTHGLIPHLLEPGFVDASTVLVLINALYLKAGWVYPFDPGTAAQPFSTLAGTVSVPYQRASGKMPLAHGPRWQAVSIPLWANLAMTVILPQAGAFQQISAGLDAALLAAATGGEEREVELTMPAFTTDVHTDLEKPLRAMGLGDLFDGPDLSGIGGGLTVSGAVHQARIAVDDKGIEAAAATALSMPSSAALAAPPVRLDRPFLYVVHDVETTTPLFLGRVTDPTS